MTLQLRQTSYGINNTSTYSKTFPPSVRTLTASEAGVESQPHILHYLCTCTSFKHSGEFGRCQTCTSPPTPLPINSHHTIQRTMGFILERKSACFSKRLSRVPRKIIEKLGVRPSQQRLKQSLNSKTRKSDATEDISGWSE